MTWTVKYRRADGALATEVVEAATRADVFAQLKARGVTPLAVAEGGTLAKPGNARRPIPRTVLRGAVAGLLVVALALAGWLLLRPLEDDALPKKQPAQVHADKAKHPQPTPRRSVGAGRAGNDEEKPALEPPQEEVKTPEEKKPEYVKRPGQMMLPNGKILTFPPPPPGQTKKVVAASRIYECDSEGNWKDVTPRKLFDTDFENQFQGLAVEGQKFIPTFLMGLDQDEVVKLLRKEVKITEEDSEEDIRKKQAVAETKRFALEYIEQGGTFDQFISEMAAAEKEQRAAKAQSLRQIMALCKEGKIEEAKALRDKHNAELREAGYSPVRLPAHVREAFGDE